MKRYLPIFLIITILLSPYLVYAETIIEPKPIRILIVPGHDNEVFGAQYKNVKEANMAAALGLRMYAILKKDKRFQVYITRNEESYTKIFSDYFKNNMDAIEVFKDNAKKANEKEVKDGTFIKNDNGVPHSNAKTHVALKLYGINKWANENNIDAIIHIHFNDDGRRNRSKPGPYEGFSVYAPEKELASSEISMPLAQNIFNDLKKKYTNSTYVRENGGVIADQKLIAMGAYDTLAPTVRTVLIEYGFIYEKKFKTYTLRKTAYNNMSKITADSITNYFFPIKK